MKYELYQAFDKVAGEAQYPIMTFHNVKEAIRTFAYHVEEACEKRPSFYSLPQVKDLDLYKIGETVSGTCKVEPLEEKEFICSASDFVDVITTYRIKNKQENNL